MRLMVYGALALAVSLAGGVNAQERRSEGLFGGNLPTFDPMIGVGFAVLNVSDMEKSVAFYKLLGLTVTLTTVAHSSVPGTPENKNLPITLFQTAPGINAGGLQLVQHDGPVALGTAYNRLGIRVADALGICKRLAEARAPCVKEPNEFQSNGVTMAIAWAKDPDGRLLELIEIRSR